MNFPFPSWFTSSSPRPDVNSSPSAVSRYFFPGFIFLFALLMRFVGRCLDPVLSRDSISYVQLIPVVNAPAQLTALLDAMSLQYIPLLPLHLANFLYRLLPVSPEQAGLWLNLLLGSGVAVIVWYMARELHFTPFWSFMAGLLAAVQPTLIELSIQIQRDTAYIFFIGLTILFALKTVRRQRWFCWGICAVSLSLALFCRYEALEFIPLFILAMIFCAKSFRQFLFFLASFMVSLLLSAVVIGSILQPVEFSSYSITQCTGYVKRFIAVWGVEAGK